MLFSSSVVDVLQWHVDVFGDLLFSGVKVNGEPRPNLLRIKIEGTESSGRPLTVTS